MLIAECFLILQAKENKGQTDTAVKPTPGVVYRRGKSATPHPTTPDESDFDLARARSLVRAKGSQRQPAPVCGVGHHNDNCDGLCFFQTSLIRVLRDFPNCESSSMIESNCSGVRLIIPLESRSR
jgi:hypothetical protein